MSVISISKLLFDKLIPVTFIGSTVTSQLADALPHVAVIIVFPTPIPDITPSVTVAISSFSEFQTIFLWVVFSGSIVAVNVSVEPISIFIDCLLMITFSAKIGSTVTSQYPVALPDVAIILVLPRPTASTNPFSVTVATFLSSDFQTRVLSVVLSGWTVPSN